MTAMLSVKIADCQDRMRDPSVVSQPVNNVHASLVQQASRIFGKIGENHVRPGSFDGEQ